MPSLPRVLDRAGDRHAVLEARHLGEEAADLELRVDPRAQAPVALEEQPLAQRDDRVAALRAAACRRRAAARSGPAISANARVGHEADAVPTRRRPRVRAPIASTTARQNASSANASASTPTPGLLAHLRHRAGREAAHARLLRLLPGERERHEVRAPARRRPSTASTASSQSFAPDCHSACIGEPCARGSARPWPRTSAAARGSAAGSRPRTARAPFSAMPMRHGTTRSRKKLIQPSNSTSTGRSSRRELLLVPASAPRRRAASRNQ